MPKIEVNNKIYNVTLAVTDEEKEKGLQNVESLDDNQGMLFCYDEPQSVGFWMKDCSLHLDIIFINEYGEVISVVEGKPNDETPLTEDNVSYVLEVNYGSNISAGDDVDLSDIQDYESEYDSSEDSEGSGEIKILLVLGEKGKPQMELEGGERIFSRPHTKTIVNLSKKAYKSKKDSDYKKLGQKIFGFIEKQNTQKQEYVST